jgi:5-methylcytosine-specific restriction protein B
VAKAKHKWVSILRLREALQSLAMWRSQNDSQGCMHLVHFLASKRCNVRKSQWQKYSENDDRDFCDTYLRVRPGTHPYYDPLEQGFRLDTHWHSNIATARKKTFADKWKAGEYKERAGGEHWRFSDNYLDSLETHMGRKAGFVPIPALDLIAWLYRGQEFDETATCRTVLDRFAADFHLTAEERKRLFVLPKHLDTVQDRRFFAFAPFDPDLTLQLVTSPDTFDLTDSIEASAQARKAPAMNANDLATFIRNGKRRQIILQGPPGTGKTFLAKHTVAHLLAVDPLALPDHHVDLVDDDNRAIRVKTFREKGSRGWSLLQFHPAYGYEEFVRGIAPTARGGSSGFEVRDRAFALACELAEHASADNPFVMVLDEINRADLAKTFGELIYGLEYRLRDSSSL